MAGHGHRLQTTSDRLTQHRIDLCRVSLVRRRSALPVTHRNIGWYEGTGQVDDGPVPAQGAARTKAAAEFGRRLPYRSTLCYIEAGVASPPAMVDAGGTIHQLSPTPWPVVSPALVSLA